MANSLWQQASFLWQRAMLSSFSFSQWLEASVLGRLTIGSLSSWQARSWFLSNGEAIGGLLVAIALATAPFSNTSLIGLLMFCGGAFWALLSVSDPKKLGTTPIHFLVLLYWGVATVATAFSPVKKAALSGWIKLTLFLVFFALMARVLQHPRVRSRLITLYLLVSLAVGAYGLRQWFQGVEALATWTDPTSPLAQMTRVYSYLGNPNLLGGYLIPSLGFSAAAVFAWRTLPQKALAIAIFACNLACIGFTFSRGAWVGVAASGAVFLLLAVHKSRDRFPPFWRKTAVPFTLLGFVGFVLLSVTFVPQVRDRVASIFVGREDSSNNFRMNVWSAVFDMIAAYPAIGIGPGNSAFNKIYPLFMRPKYTALSAYSVFLEITVELGFIGLAVFIWLLLAIWHQGWTQLNRLQNDPQGYWIVGAMAATAGLMAHGLVDTVWYRPAIQTLWWFCVAAIASFYVPEATSRREGNVLGDREASTEGS